MEISEETKKILLLVNDRPLYHVLENAFSEKDIVSSDAFEERLDFDAVVLDLFFLQAGMADFVRQHQPGIPIVCAVQENQSWEIQSSFLRSIDSVLMIPNSAPYYSLYRVVQQWMRTLEENEVFARLFKEFGSGLWVSLVGPGFSRFKTSYAWRDTILSEA